MTRPGKVNVAMSKTIDYRVGLQPDGSAQTTLSLSYANTAPYPPHMPSVFQDWLRVYRAAGTIFPAVTRAEDKTATVAEFGFPAEVRTFTLRRGESSTEILTARVPSALRADAALAAEHGGAEHYGLYFVRQNDLEDIPTVVAVTAPPGWHVTGANARLIASGKSLPVTVLDDRIRLAVPLSGDLELDVQFASF